MRMQSHIEIVPSPAVATSERLAVSLARVWSDKDCAASLALVIHSHMRERLGRHLFCSGKATTAGVSLDYLLIRRCGIIGRVDREFPRIVKGLVFTSRHFTALFGKYGLRQDFIPPHYPLENGMIELSIRTLKEQSVHRLHVEGILHTGGIILYWTSCYSKRRPHQALAYACLSRHADQLL